MSNRRAASTLALGVCLAGILAAAGCHRSETTDATSGGPHEPPMLAHVKQSQSARKPASQSPNP